MCYFGHKHILHSTLEKGIIERTIQYIKDRTECFDDNFPYRREKCNYNISVLVQMHLLTIIIRKG
jgi:hypothetical protein